MSCIALNTDCLEYMRSLPDNCFDLCIADPPYGRNEDGGRSRSKMVRQKNGSSLYVPDGGYEKRDWDRVVPREEVFREILRISRDQIVFGVNYMNYSFGPGRLIWDKCNDGSDQSDAEIAYSSLTDRVDIFRFMWRGMMQGKSIREGMVQQGNKQKNEIRIHPTQKPVALYKWILTTFRCLRNGNKVFDPFLGSGSSRIAAFDMGFDFIGCEIDKVYFDLEEKRFEEHTRQTRMF